MQGSGFKGSGFIGSGFMGSGHLSLATGLWSLVIDSQVAVTT